MDDVNLFRVRVHPRKDRLMVGHSRVNLYTPYWITSTCYHGLLGEYYTSLADADHLRVGGLRSRTALFAIMMNDDNN